MNKFRPTGIPLVNSDPYLNIWSFADKLYEDCPRHWTGTRSNMLGVIKIDGSFQKFMGMVQHDGRYNRECRCLEQTDLKITPLRTIYTFGSPVLTLTVSFCTPLLPSDLKLASWPVSYISYELNVRDGKEHDIELYFGISGELAVNTDDQSLIFSKYEHGAKCGRGKTADMLTVNGDDRRIDYGWLHIFSENGCPSVYDIQNLASKFSIRGRFHMNPVEMEENREIPYRDCFGTIGISESFKVYDKKSGFVCIAMDDIHSINYFGKQIDAYYKKDGDSFEDVCQKAISEYNDIMAKVEEFDNEVITEAMSLGEKYCDIVSLAYRQAFGSHKMTFDGEEIQFFSKECYSNGCIGTVDITYPSMPMFLKYAPKLVEGMLNPIFKYAASEDWPYDFAPHDVGRYPLATGQVYGRDRKTGELQYDSQMPVEECGNMIIAVCALCLAYGDFSYAEKHFGILELWVKYLSENGLDPENQLCTDDFAGHLAHNVNLSAKAIMGIASFACICEKLGKSDDEKKYRELSQELAGKWTKSANSGDHYRLAFDKDDSWSLKYNLVWDKLLGFGIFDEEIFKTETEYYKTKMNRYGVPLDSRKNYTKSDWEMWTTVLSDDKEYFDMICDSLWNMLNESFDRVPFGDWYDTLNADAIMFQNRTVQGGLFINMLKLL